MSTLVLVALLLAGLTGAQKPAAIQICLETPAGVALFADAPRRNYRALDDPSGAVWMLDLDVRLNGKAPERITRNGPKCLRAWIAAEPLSTLAVEFDRTDLNLVSATHSVKLSVRPDLWYDGGSFTIERAPLSRIETSLPGKLTVERMEDAEWSRGAHPVRDLSALPSGRYAVRYEAPPAPLGSCAITVRAQATGTIREDNRPAQLAELVETYRRDYAAEVAKQFKATCSPSQALVIELEIMDGTYHAPWTPKVVKISQPEREPKYQLVQDGKPSRFVDGQEILLGYGERLVLEEAAATVASADRQQP